MVSRWLWALLLFLTTNSLAAERIVSLAPHTTEWIYTLGAGDRLVGVSDYSDYPVEAQQLPSVASHQGVDFELLLRLKPDLVVAWQGGNKTQDIARIRSLGFNIFLSQPKRLEDIGTEIESLGAVLQAQPEARRVIADFYRRLTNLRAKYADQPAFAGFFYMHPVPLMTVNQHTWASHLMQQCGIANVFADSQIDYPQVTLEQVLSRKPEIIIAAVSVPEPQIKAYWQTWVDLEQVTLVKVEPNLFHRYTPRILQELDKVCQHIWQSH